MIEALFGPTSGLIGLFAAAFLSATLLPGGSEIVMVAYLRMHPDMTVGALIIATAGNTLGGLSSVWLGRRLPIAPTERWSAGALAWIQRHGALALLLSWLPLVGDALCVAAGWLRLPWAPVALWITLGKFLRYLVVVLLVA